MSRLVSAHSLISVDSPAFVFSPGNWTGDDGRGGAVFRQTWNPGAYFRVTWETEKPGTRAKILLDTSTFPADFPRPHVTYCVDGIWKHEILPSHSIRLETAVGAGKHEVCLYFSASEQKERWGSPGRSGLNVLRVIGLEIDADSRPLAGTCDAPWALIVGDSITEGICATELASYSHLVGQALRALGYEYGINACGYSGWLNPGDAPPGDVPGYYVVKNSTDGVNGDYVDALSRWNKLDGNGHSLLDAAGRLSAYGRIGQEPSLVLINYGTNDAIYGSDEKDTEAAVFQCLGAMHTAAPRARKVLLIPFGQFLAPVLKRAVERYRRDHPADANISVIDLGQTVADSLQKDMDHTLMLARYPHPNDRGCANFAAMIIPPLVRLLASSRP